MEEMVEYIISDHCKQRYAERIMGRDQAGIGNARQFAVENEEKIHADINKLIEYGTLIFSGQRSQKDGKGDVIDVYLRDCWVVLVDNQAKVAVTLFKIDLGLDDEFNKAYVAGMVEKLTAQKAVLEDVQKQVQEESDTYREIINDAEEQIKEYRTMIRNLEELCTGYRTVISNNSVRVAQATKDVAGIVNQLIGKKEF